MNLTIKEVVELSGSRTVNAHRNFPLRSSDRYKNNLYVPKLSPKFVVDANTQGPIYVIGSCFAREIEDCLDAMGLDVPTKRFVAPEEVAVGGRPNFSLNQYNPGCIGQILVSGLQKKNLDHCIHRTPDGQYIDLLVRGQVPITLSRVYGRHNDICDLYKSISDAKLLIITLGLTECWYDNETNMWLNRAPPIDDYTIKSVRYTLRDLDYNKSIECLEPAIALLGEQNIKTIITVSPVPLQTTFTNNDCVIANEYNKSTLRAVCNYFVDKFDHVDYFPSYEMVRHYGQTAYRDDNVHVKLEFVEHVTQTMIKTYMEHST